MTEIRHKRVQLSYTNALILQTNHDLKYNSIMFKISTLLLLKLSIKNMKTPIITFLSLILIWYIYSCSNDTYKDSSFLQKKNLVLDVRQFYLSDGFYSKKEIEEWNEKIKELGWEKQLELIMKNQDIGLGELGLVLKGYSYKGLIDKQEIEEYILNKNSLFPVYDPINSFRLLPIESIETSSAKWIEKQRNFLDSIYNTGIEAVILNWEYKTNKFSTMALVSDESGGIKYDNILSNITIKQTIELEDSVTFGKIPSIKSRTENENSINKNIIKGERILGSFFMPDASVITTGTVTGTIENGQKSISNFSEHTEIYTRPGSSYTANSRMEAKEIKRGINGYVDIIYAYYIAYEAKCTITGGINLGAFNVSITENSSGGYVKRDSGTEYVTASALN